MDPDKPDIRIADVVLSTAGHDRGGIFFVVGAQDEYLILADGKSRPFDNPKRKKYKHVQKLLRPETRVAMKLRSGDKVLNSELRRDLTYIAREMQAET